ncbi:MAG: RNA polymerase sigma factor [Verrucomicrobium sp.]|nr:sigma-70 family RNA polymerase sigma factor [Verrucomicrobium sp.]
MELFSRGIMDGVKSAFPNTQWTAVVSAACSDNTERRQQALSGLCQDYWRPLYAFSRRLGHDVHDAQDLTQGFFAYLLQHGVLHTASRELGTLRTFLLKIFQRYIRDVKDRDSALKRGGGMHFISLNAGELGEACDVDMAALETPELSYDRAWAHEVLRGALQQLGNTEKAAGRGRLFEVLESCLNPETINETNYGNAAAQLGMTQEAVRQIVSRLRKKFRECLRSKIAATLHEPDDERIDEELRALRAVLRG